jgi:hypothetical protein
VADASYIAKTGLELMKYQPAGMLAPEAAEPKYAFPGAVLLPEHVWVSGAETPLYRVMLTLG